MVELELSAAEHSARKLNPEHLQQAIAALHDDGFVVLHRAIDPAHIELLRERMLADVEETSPSPTSPISSTTGTCNRTRRPSRRTSSATCWSTTSSSQ